MSTETPHVEPYEGHDGREGVLVRTPYHEGFIADLKEIPSGDRRWDIDGTQAWWVAEEHADTLTHLLIQYFGGYERVDPDTGALDYVDARGARARP